MSSELDRRTFNRLAAASLGGMVTGTLTGCPSGGAKKDDDKKDGDETKVAKHACRGLNVCKGSITEEHVARALGYDYVPPESALENC